MSLEEIKMIRQGLPVEEFMVRKKSELLRRIAEDTVRISKIETYMSNEKELRQYNILIKELPEVIVASMRHVIKNYGEFFDIYPAMGAEMERCGCVCALPEYCFSIYHDGGYREEDIDVEICEAVTELKAGSNGLAFKVVPRVETAACALHKGAYDDFPQAYAALMRWMEDNGYEPNGYPRESYIDGIWNKESSSEWLTEIQFPVRKI